MWPVWNWWWHFCNYWMSHSSNILVSQCRRKGIPVLYNVHGSQCTMSTVHFTLSTVHRPLFTVHSPLSTVLFALSTVHYSLSTVHSPQSTVQYIDMTEPKHMLMALVELSRVIFVADHFLTFSNWGGSEGLEAERSGRRKGVKGCHWIDLQMSCFVIYGL